jgi:hypothetical protein
VCAEWFARCRELLLRLANAAGCPHHALHHGAARLADLRGQLRALAAADSARGQPADAARSGTDSTAASGPGPAAAAAAPGRGVAGAGRGRGRGRLGGGRGPAPSPEAAAAALSGLSLQQRAPMALLGQRQAAAGPGTEAAPPAASADDHRARHEAALQRLAPAASDALVGCAAALLALRDADGLRGLREWAADAFGPLWKHQAQAQGLEFETELEEEAAGSGGGGGALGWLRALEAAAAGRLDEAAGGLSRAATRPGLAPSVQALALEALGECFAGLEEWQALSGAQAVAAEAAAPLLAAAREAAAAANEAVAEAQPAPGGAPVPATAQARARAAAAASTRAAAAAAAMQQAQAALLGHWTFAEGAAAQAGGAAAGSSDGVIAACLAVMRRQQGGGAAAAPGAQGLHAPLRAAARERCDALADWCAAAAWLGAPALAPQLRRLAALRHLLQPDARADRPPAAAAAVQALLQGGPRRVDAGAPPCAWAELLGDDGSLVSSCAPSVGLQDLAPLAVLARAGSAKAPALAALQRVAALAAARGGCRGALERALSAAEALAAAARPEGQASPAPPLAQEPLWVRAVGARLRLACGDAGGGADSGLTGEVGGGPARLLAAAVREHLALLAGAWPHEAQPAAAAEGEAAAAGFMSLASVLRRAPGSSAGAAAAAADAPPDWRAAFDAALAALAERGALRGAGAGAPTIALPEASAPLAACCAAAAAAAPAAPGPWRAFGDLLYGLAWEQPGEEGAAPPADSAAPPANGPPPAAAPGPRALSERAAHALALAAGAYCRHLAAGAAAGRLAAPEDGLAPMLRVLRLVLRHGAALGAPLRAALGAAPAAAWQALAPQLLAAALGHRAAETRGLAALLLRGLAAAAPCAVLYPCIVELRAAEERGEQVGASQGCVRALVSCRVHGCCLEPRPHAAKSNKHVNPAPPARSPQVAPELQGVLRVLRRRDARLLPDTAALVEGLERLTVTPPERWAALLAELEVSACRSLSA